MLPPGASDGEEFVKSVGRYEPEGGHSQAPAIQLEYNRTQSAIKLEYNRTQSAIQLEYNRTQSGTSPGQPSN